MMSFPKENFESFIESIIEGSIGRGYALSRARVIWNEALAELREKVEGLPGFMALQATVGNPSPDRHPRGVERLAVLALLDEPEMFKRSDGKLDGLDIPPTWRVSNERKGERRESFGRRACFSGPFGRRQPERVTTIKGADIAEPPYGRRLKDRRKERSE